MAKPLVQATLPGNQNGTPQTDTQCPGSTLSSTSSVAPPRDVVLGEYIFDQAKQEYRIKPKQLYRNNLLAAVGLFELTNALDFPANVWNEVPPKLFAQVLMGIGGSICFLWSFFGVWDLIRSRRNIKLLWQERRDLQCRLAEDGAEKDAKHASQVLLQAWLDINYRELGWEYVDRAIMDGIMVIASILVGIGTMLAIRGDIPVVFDASNLMSGYIGNSFVALYAVINTAWSVYMWRHASGQLAAIRNARSGVDSDTRRRMTAHARQHQLYAAVNAATVLVSGAGSLVSATLWYGYVIIVPCVFGSVFANLFWRFRLGYNRKSYGEWIGRCVVFDLCSHLTLLHNVRLSVKVASLPDIWTKRQNTDDYSDFVRTLEQFGLADIFGGHLMNIQARSDEKSAISSGTARTLTGIDVRSCDTASVQSALAKTFAETNAHTLRDQERFLLELYGCYLVGMQKELSRVVEPKQSRERGETTV
ncbi:hypothetical protein LTR78_000049 [Recurvomyces mirabilis]|uniref:Integral membrane protein n=1 Tax=Recurvomyces mirabilis TaxID=574656 RepID=A0AAE0WXB4_9PEZI|nr:hypothetical protein LTR78_000049 [Recurvomyces mirabilis]KAK5161705.1 hypothetical protein LTS14_000050 [Recurvomyces mirabilis]